MRKIILSCLFFFICLTSLTGKDSQKEQSNRREIKQIGIITDFSYLKELSVGLGLGYGKMSTFENHWFGYRYGLLTAYRFEKKFYSLRPFYNIMGGSGGILLGLATPVITDRDKYSIGISPQIGVSLFGYFDLFYRYNAYLKSEFNNHEIGFTLLINFAD